MESDFLIASCWGGEPPGTNAGTTGPTCQRLAGTRGGGCFEPMAKEMAKAHAGLGGVSQGRGTASQSSPGEHGSPGHSWEVEHDLGGDTQPRQKGEPLVVPGSELEITVSDYYVPSTAQTTPQETSYLTFCRKKLSHRGQVICPLI